MKVPSLVISGHFPNSRWGLETNHKYYSQESAIPYIHFSYCTPATNPYMHKLHWILDAMEIGDFVIWIDDDSFFIDRLSEAEISSLMSCSGFFISGGPFQKEKNLQPPIAASFFGLKSTEENKALLDTAINLTDQEVASSWKSSYGKMYGGDQDRLYLVFRQKIQTGTISLLKDPIWAGRAENIVAGETAKIIHLTGRVNKKQKKKKQISQHLNLNITSMLPNGVHRKLPLINMGAWKNRIVIALEHYAIQKAASKLLRILGK